MQIRIPDRVVLFDYGEVISRSPSEADRAAILAVADVPAGPFWAAYAAHRNDLDGGFLSSDEYWTRIAAECGTQWDSARRQALWNADMRAWISAEPDVVATIEALTAGGTRLAVLSNAAEEYGGLLRHSPISRWFEQVFVSGELRMLKPDPTIYLHVCRELGIAPAALVFVDNRAENVLGAESIGATGHVFTGPDGLVEFLTALTERNPG
ncbi:HAD family hydrolase [Amnibacterium sp.]|uniref:HAD family hydrolase n=1 Tax=Amnibacterium sp. TaxID=1872496 RepID=UPI00261B80AC|nr:HAD family phosphatase [Amnibacterium sp.]MCU1472136.1 family phosphatase [Amnibacterium sp.]